MKVKVTDKEFTAFKDEFIRWQHILGLTQYQIYFEKSDIGDCWAQISWDTGGYCATVTLTSEYEKEVKDHRNILKSARHEAFHLLLAEMMTAGMNRWGNREELDRADEATVRRLENAFDFIGGSGDW